MSVDLWSCSDGVSQGQPHAYTDGSSRVRRTREWFLRVALVVLGAIAASTCVAVYSVRFFAEYAKSQEVQYPQPPFLVHAVREPSGELTITVDACGNAMDRVLAFPIGSPDELRPFGQSVGPDAPQLDRYRKEGPFVDTAYPGVPVSVSLPDSGARETVVVLNWRGNPSTEGYFRQLPRLENAGDEAELGRGCDST